MGVYGTCMHHIPRLYLTTLRFRVYGSAFVSANVWNKTLAI
jgi:hypothetical protein